MATQPLQTFEVHHLTTKPPVTLAPLDLLSIALENNAAIDVIERLAALQEKAVAREAEIEFSTAMNAAQSEIGRIAPDAINTQTNSKWASYAELDRVLRPVYIKHGFSLSYDGGNSPLPDTVQPLCYVSHRGGHTRTYTSPPIPCDGKGAKGGDVMTKTHAVGAAMSYGKRYLVVYIFNVAIAEAEDENDGNAPAAPKIKEWCEVLRRATSRDQLKALFRQAWVETNTANDSKGNATVTIAYNARKKELA